MRDNSRNWAPTHFSNGKMGKLVRCSSTGDKLATTIARKPEERFLSVEIRARGRASPREKCGVQGSEWILRIQAWHAKTGAGGAPHRDARIKPLEQKCCALHLTQKQLERTHTKCIYLGPIPRHAAFSLFRCGWGQNKQHRRIRIPWQMNQIDGVQRAHRITYCDWCTAAKWETLSAVQFANAFLGRRPRKFLVVSWLVSLFLKFGAPGLKN